MKGIRRPPLGPTIAAAACLASIVALAIVHVGGGPQPPEGPWPPARLAESKFLPPPPATGASGESDTVSRPLFAPSRRPDPPAAPAPTQAARDKYQLQGTIRVGDMEVAMLRDKQTGRVEAAAKGATLSDMTVVEVHRDRVLLRAVGLAEEEGNPGAGTETLQLVVATGPQAKPPVPPGSAAPGAAAPAAVPPPSADGPAAAAPPAAAARRGSRASAGEESNRTIRRRGDQGAEGGQDAPQATRRPRPEPTDAQREARRRLSTW